MASQDRDTITRMVNLLAAIQEASAPLVEPMHEVMALAQIDVDRSCPLARTSEYQWYRTHSIRAYAVHHMRAKSEAEEIGNWRTTGNVRRNGQFWLTSLDGRFRVRVLREAPGNRVPHAGANMGRRGYYTNDSTAPSLFGLDNCQQPECHRLLLVWDELGEAEFTLRLVRPTGTGSIRTRVPIDIDIPMPRTRTDFEGLKFDVQDNMEDVEVDDDLGDEI